ncbi:MAG: hypothetical protein AB2L11_03395 [Syntrophobacteraceae bacterium]
MYLSSFVHREELFNIAEHWFCGRTEATEALRLTEILISDGFIIGENLEVIARLLLETLYQEPIHPIRVRFKGELRDAICRCPSVITPEVQRLCRLYRENPDFYYREAPINGVMCLNEREQLVGLYRIKRPRRIAEKANRRIANWIFGIVQDRAIEMAEKRASRAGVSLDWLFTPEKEMVQEFIEAETDIARGFAEGSVRLDRSALTIHDIAGVKIIADEDKLAYLERVLEGDPAFRIVDRHNFPGKYKATNLVLEVTWDAEYICRRFRDSKGWEKYGNRGISEKSLKDGFAALLRGAKPTMNIEVVLSTFPDMVESEFGDSIHEKMIISQRDNRIYKGYIPMNVEFLLEFLFAVGFSPRVKIDELPFKLWGRYLPDTLISYIRRLYDMPEWDLFY